MSPESQFWWNWFVQLGIAVGTIGAVCVALFGHVFRAFIWPPKLRIRMVNVSGERTPIHLRDAIGGTVQSVSRFYHVRVENDRRRFSPALDVRLLLLRLEEPDAAGEYQTKWTGEVPLQWAYQQIKPIMINMGAPDQADLCSVTKGPNGLAHTLRLHPIIYSFALPTQWEAACRLAVVLKAVSRDGDSEPLRVEISWDGQWADDTDDMSRHLVFKSTRIPPLAAPTPD